MVSLVTLVLLATSATLTSASPWSLDPLRWAGGTSHWYAGKCSLFCVVYLARRVMTYAFQHESLGPDVNNVPYEVPEGCVVDTAAFVSRHGARFPDPGSYQGWLTLAAKVSSHKSHRITRTNIPSVRHRSKTRPFPSVREVRNLTSSKHGSLLLGIPQKMLPS